MSRQISPELEAALRKALRSGNKEEARRIFRQATGAGERFARFAVFLMSHSKVSDWSPDPTSEDSGSRGSTSASPTPERAPRETPSPPPAAAPSGDVARSAVKASSGCGSMILLGLSPLLFAAAWLLAV